ncbi:hypothetical protein FI667_g3019, partial [Globisporangium splendens]
MQRTTSSAARSQACTALFHDAACRRPRHPLWDPARSRARGRDKTSGTAELLAIVACAWEHVGRVGRREQRLLGVCDRRGVVAIDAHERLEVRQHARLLSSEAHSTRARVAHDELAGESNRAMTRKSTTWDLQQEKPAAVASMTTDSGTRLINVHARDQSLGNTHHNADFEKREINGRVLYLRMHCSDRLESVELLNFVDIYLREHIADIHEEPPVTQTLFKSKSLLALMLRTCCHGKRRQAQRHTGKRVTDSMSSLREDAANTSPLDPEPSLALVRMDDNESDGGEWPEWQELLPEWSGDLDEDVLGLDTIFASATKDHARDAASLPHKPGSQPKTGRKRCANTLSTRAKRAMEIRRLQQECKDLCGTLLALRERVKAAGSARRQPLPLSMRTGAELRSHLAGTPWETQAGRQRELLLLAECANRNLKFELEVQKREARSLHRVLSKRIADAKVCALSSLATKCLVEELVHIYSSSTKAVDPIAADLLGYAYGVCKTVGGDRSNALEDRHDATASSFQGLVPCTAEEDTAFVEMIDVEELPFSVPHVHHAIVAMYRADEMDQFAKQVQLLFPCNFNASDDTIMSTAFSTYDQGDEIVHVRLRQVVQHFVADTYAVLVSTFIVDSLTNAWTPSPHGLVKRVQEWRVVCPSDDGTTLHQTIAILVPEFSHPTVLDPSRPTFGKRVVMQQIDAWLASFEHTNSKIENLLTNPSLSSKRAPLSKMTPVHKRAPQISFPAPPSLIA